MHVATLASGPQDYSGRASFFSLVAEGFLTCTVQKFHMWWQKKELLIWCSNDLGCRCHLLEMSEREAIYP